jgi:hypothetical protein
METIIREFFALPPSSNANAEQQDADQQEVRHAPEK